MKQFRLIMAMLLALILTFAPLMQVSAAGQAQYISEISIGYGDDGKTALENAGYTVWADLNANEGGNGSAVWLGYKTTTDANEAVTDIALMNMKGGYSFDAYTKEIESLNQKVSEQLASFRAAIAEFRANYAQDNLFAKQAYTALNYFYEDDTLTADGTPMKLGDLFLDEATPEETLHRIFLEGNTEAVTAIETALALGCTEIGEDNVLSRLAEAEYPETLDAQKNAARTALKSTFADLHSEALSMQALAEEIEGFEGGAEAFFAQETMSEEQLVTYAVAYAKYLFMTENPFGTTGMTLYDFAMLDEEAENENGEVLEDEYLEMLAQSMTDGQLGIVANVGILTVLLNASASTDTAEAEAALAEAAPEEAVEPASVYCGVDRTLFEDIDSIALTSAALREKAAAQGSDFGKDANADDTAAIALTVAAAATNLVGVALASANFRLAIRPYFTEKLEVFETEWDVWTEKVFVAHVNVAGIALTVVGCVMIIASVVLTIFAILEWVLKPVVPKTKYTAIPRVIVEKSETDGSFIPYYAAKLAGAAEGETDSTKLYGDLNALNTMDQWVALYYSKNPTLGAPLTPELLKSESSTPNAGTEGYTAIHMFGSTNAANLNQYNTKKGAKAIYVFLRTDASEVAQSGSVFTKSSVIMSVVTLLAGAAIATAVTYLVMRRKKETAAA